MQNCNHMNDDFFIYLYPKFVCTSHTEKLWLRGTVNLQYAKKIYRGTKCFYLFCCLRWGKRKFVWEEQEGKFVNRGKWNSIGECCCSIYFKRIFVFFMSRLISASSRRRGILKENAVVHNLFFFTAHLTRSKCFAAF